MNIKPPLSLEQANLIISQLDSKEIEALTNEITKKSIGVISSNLLIAALYLHKNYTQK